MVQKLTDQEKKLHDLTTYVKTVLPEMKNIIADQSNVCEKILTTISTQNLQKMSEEHNASPTVDLNQYEDFSEFEHLQPMDSSESLGEFEFNLQNTNFSDKFVRYLSTKYATNGNGNAARIFKQLIRKLTSTELFLPFTWKGNKHIRNNDSFEDKHAVFVKFIFTVLAKIDRNCKMDEVNDLFRNHFRFKNVDHKRKLKQMETNNQSPTSKCMKPNPSGDDECNN